jgi:transcriptional regulator with XRE-family HTH domain
MGFRENLKEALNYKGMLVKELASASGVKLGTISSYLKENGYAPSAENAVLIARALGVSVEYLVTGAEAGPDKAAAAPVPNSEFRQLAQATEHLTEGERHLILKTALFLAENFKESRRDR